MIKGEKNMDIELLPVDNREEYKPLLLLADEEVDIVDAYLHEGELTAIRLDSAVVGVCLFVFPDEESVEIKNIAISEAYRGKGIGKRVITKAAQQYKEKGYTSMIVGTSNSSIENLSFYQKAGFRFDHILPDYFLRYPQPFYENGIRGIDMVVFRKSLLD